ncbi:hypothetical protein CS542_07960 [Pedobacter sp. IW39]|nr:hypothetical protein CS542_07960 [Pedobacter sp. IW39]
MERGVRKSKIGRRACSDHKDKLHPFIVESGNQQVEVLGTHFNVHAYRAKRFLEHLTRRGVVSENGNTKILSPGLKLLMLLEKFRSKRRHRMGGMENNKFILIVNE